MNNTDDQYLKMVLALPDEFFEGWGWKDGDSFIRLYDGHAGYLGNYKIDEQSMQFTRGSSGAGRLEYIRPIPSQEQLQKKCIDFENKDNPYSRSNDFSISKRFIALVIEGDLVHDIENKTLKEMWLEFAEYVIYGKTWDGEAWMPADD